MERRYSPLDVVLAIDLWAAQALDEHTLWRVLRGSVTTDGWEEALRGLGHGMQEVGRRTRALSPFLTRLAGPQTPIVDALVLPRNSPVRRSASPSSARRRACCARNAVPTFPARSCRRRPGRTGPSTSATCSTRCGGWRAPRNPRSDRSTSCRRCTGSGPSTRRGPTTPPSACGRTSSSPSTASRAGTPPTWCASGSRPAGCRIWRPWSTTTAPGRLKSSPRCPSSS